MAKVKSFSKEMIDKLSGVIDFYYWKGIPVARRWPRKTDKLPSAPMLAARAAFTESRIDLRLVSGKVRQAWASASIGIKEAWLDYYTSVFMRIFKNYKRSVAVVQNFDFDNPPGQRCITLKGLRLSGQKICLFDKFPTPLSKHFRKRGVYDVCMKLRYGKPHFCIPLVGGGEIISEIPFPLVPGLWFYDYKSDPMQLFNTPDLALSNMWARGPVPHPLPGPPKFLLRYLSLVYEAAPHGWTSTGNFNTLEFLMQTSLLNPAWRNDNNISFSIAFNSPAILGAPAWTSLVFRDKSVAFNSGAYEQAVEKEAFYEEDVAYDFKCLPVNFNFADYNILPFFGDTLTKGWDYIDKDFFNFRLVVRRGTVDYRVCWSTDISRAAKIAAVVDTESGLVVGPPIKIN